MTRWLRLATLAFVLAILAMGIVRGTGRDALTIAAAGNGNGNGPQYDVSAKVRWTVSAANPMLMDTAVVDFTCKKANGNGNGNGNGPCPSTIDVTVSVNDTPTHTLGSVSRNGIAVPSNGNVFNFSPDIAVRPITSVSVAITGSSQ